MYQRITNDDFWEEVRLVAVNQPEAIAFQKKMEAMTSRLVPWHDQSKEPIHFVIVDSKDPNAFYLEKSKAGNGDHIIAFSKGLLKMVENEDQLAFVLGHELGHFGLVKDLGSGKNSLGEERIVDTLGALQWMANAGYSPEEGIRFFHNLAKLGDASVGKELSQSLDVHGTDRTRIEDQKAKVSSLLVARGTAINTIATPFTDKETYLKAKHKTFLDEKKEAAGYDTMPQDKKIEFIKNLLPVLNGSPRENDFAGTISTLFTPQQIKDEDAAFQAIPRHALVIGSPNRTHVLHVFNHLDRRDLLKHFPEQQPLFSKLEAFMNAKDYVTAKRTADEYIDLYGKSVFGRKGGGMTTDSYKDYFHVPKFIIPDGPEAIGQEVPWNKLAVWSQQDQSLNIARLLHDVLGVEDERIPQVPFEDNKYLGRLFRPLSKDSYQKGIGEYVVSEDGIITGTDRNALKKEAERLRQIEREKMNTAKHEHWNKYKLETVSTLGEAYKRVKERKYDSIDAFRADAVMIMSERHNYNYTRGWEVDFKQHPEWAPVANKYTLPDRRPVKEVGYKKDGNGKYERDENGKTIIGSDRTTHAEFFQPLQNEMANTFYSLADKLLRESAPENKKKVVKDVADYIRESSMQGRYDLLPITPAGQAGLQKFIMDHQQELINEDYGLKKSEVLTELFSKEIFYDREETNTGDKRFSPLKLAKKDLLDNANLGRKHQASFKDGESDVLNFTRAIAGYSTPENVADLAAVRDKVVKAFNTPDKDYAKWVSTDIAQMEVFQYLRNPAHKEFDTIKILKPLESNESLFSSREFKLALNEFLERNNAWPKEPEKLIKLYKYMDEEYLFASTMDTKEKLLIRIMDTIEQRSGRGKNDLIEMMLAGAPVYQSASRAKLVKEWVDLQVEKLGKDDNTDAYRQAIAPIIQRIKTSEINMGDRADMFRQLADRIVSQRNVSEDLSAFATIDRETLAKESQKGHITEVLFAVMCTDSDMTQKSIDYLINPATEKSTRSFITEFVKRRDRIGQLSKGQNVAFDTYVNAANLEALHENFWGNSVPVRAYFTNRLLAAYAATTRKDNDKRPEWKRQQEFVTDKVLTDTSEESKKARNAIAAYTESLDDSQRSYFLSAVLSATPPSEGQSKGSMHKVGEGLAAFCEMMGPGETKLGQSLHSFPGTPGEIREALENIKGFSDVPARWDIFNWMDTYVPKKVTDSIGHVDEVLGAGSYFVAIGVKEHNGDEGVLRILRPHARERAEKGFERLLNTAKAMQKAEKGTGFAAKFMRQKDTIATTLEKMLTQAQKMSAVETDMHLGADQVMEAHRLYDGKVIKVDGYSFTFKTTPWKNYGDAYAYMAKAPGKSFNKLPSATTEDLAFKKASAKANMAMELLNILKGGHFDHDRHGEQQNINRTGSSTADIWIYDTGAMSLETPKTKDKVLMADMAYGILNAASKGEDVGKYVLGYVGKMEKRGIHSQYVVEFQKAALALQDFIEFQKEKTIDGKVVQQKRTLSPEDLNDVLKAVAQTGELDSVITNIFKMKLVQRGTVNKFSAMAKNGGEGAIQIEQTVSKAPEIPPYIEKEPIPGRAQQGHFIVNKNFQGTAKLNSSSTGRIKPAAFIDRKDDRDEQHRA